MAQDDHSKKEYRRLPGRRKSFFGGLSTLWQGRDHLLSILYTFGTERYKRFYYRDIQAFVIRKTAAGKIQNVVLTALAALFGLLASSRGEIGVAIFGLLAFAMVLILLLNIWRGPTCKCLIQTAVQKEKLKNFYRFKTAVKAIERISPLLQNVQGSLAAEDLRSTWLSAPARKADIRNSPAAAGRADHRPLKIHRLFFCTLLCLGLINAAMFYRQNMVLVLTQMIFGLAAAVLLIPALVRQHQGDAAKAVRVITWISLGYLTGYLINGYAVYMFIVLQHRMVLYDEWQVLKLAAALPPQSHPLLFGIYMFAGIGALALGLAGLVAPRRA